VNSASGLIVDFFEGTTSCLLPKTDIVYDEANNKYPIDNEGVNFISQHLADGLVGLTTFPKFNLYVEGGILLTLFQSSAYVGLPGGELDNNYYTIII
jgi:hypothetical protein